MIYKCYIKFFEWSFEINTKREWVFNDFCFVMREYICNNQEFDYFCNLDEMSFFEHPCIVSKYYISVGSAVRYLNKTIVIFSPPYTGKTTFARSLVSKGGFLISDDILIIERETLKIFPIKKPVCYREGNIRKMNLTLDRLEHLDVEYRCFCDEYGERIVAHPFDIERGNYYSNSTYMDDIYIRTVNENESILTNLVKVAKCRKIEDVSLLSRLVKKTNCKLCKNIYEMINI